MRSTKIFSFFAVAVALLLTVTVFFFVTGCDPDSSVYEKGMADPDDETDNEKEDGKTDPKKEDPGEEETEPERCVENYCEKDPNSNGDCFINPKGGYYCGCNIGFYWNYDKKVCSEIIILSTGQTKCYDSFAEIVCPEPGMPFYGQDANFNISNQRLFGIIGSAPEEIVEDVKTFLQWQRTMSDKTMTLSAAESYCNNLNYGGHIDWRLPSVYELVTIINYGDFNPSINTSDFPDTYPNLFVTATTYKDNIDMVWLVSFATGGAGMNAKDGEYHVRCVRGAAWAPNGNFSEGNYVTHNATGFKWMKTDYSTSSWEDALNYCNTSTAGGFTWRLPTINDLLAITDALNYSDPATWFPGMVSDKLVTSTTHDNNTDYAWSVNFMSGGTTPVRKTGKNMVVKQTSIPKDDECDDVAGIRIEAGIDDNENGVLDNDEIDPALTKYVCNEEGLEALAVFISESPGVNCPQGGYKLIAGIDYNENSNLDPDEIDETFTKFYCNTYHFVKCVSYPTGDTRAFSCSAKPEGTEWNTVSSYIQTWNGTTWDPPESETHYNETPSTTECRFKCAANYTWDGVGLECVPATQYYDCPPKPEPGTVWNTVPGYEQTWDGEKWVPVADPTTDYNVLGSTIVCRYKCAENYTWNGTVCEADTKIYFCPPKPTTGTVWNTVDQYEQTWDGTKWVPVDSTPEYNTTSSTTECRYKCDVNYTWSISSELCVADTRIWNCATDGGAKDTNSDWNTADQYEQTWDGTKWVPGSTFTEHNTVPSSTDCRFTCKANYTWNGTACEADTQTHTCTAKPASGTKWNNVSSYTQTWSGSEWLPAATETEYNVTASDTACRFECLDKYNWSEGDYECVPETQAFYCDTSLFPENAEWNTVNYYEQTWDGTAWVPADSVTHYNTTSSTTECRFKCKTNYTWNGTVCEASTKTYLCKDSGFKLPANALWNTVDGYEQTWSGTEWLPPATYPEFNTKSSTTECRFVCDVGYTWDPGTGSCK